MLITDTQQASEDGTCGKFGNVCGIPFECNMHDYYTLDIPRLLNNFPYFTSHYNYF